MIRRPPRSTLFPTRRSSDLSDRGGQRRGNHRSGDAARRSAEPRPHRRVAAPRSEEHTSELQSHSDLVCRLLLEKKKSKKLITKHKYKKVSYQRRSKSAVAVP